MGFSRGGVQGAEELALHVFGQSSALASSLNHLVSDLLRRSGHEVVGFQPQFREEAGQGLFAEVAFLFGNHRNQMVLIRSL